MAWFVNKLCEKFNCIAGLKGLGSEWKLPGKREVSFRPSPMIALSIVQNEKCNTNKKFEFSIDLVEIMQAFTVKTFYHL